MYIIIFYQSAVITENHISYSLESTLFKLSEHHIPSLFIFRVSMPYTQKFTMLTYDPHML